MRFLVREDARLLGKKLGREIAECAGPRSVLYCESGSRDYAAAVNAIVLSIGKFSEATLVFLWCLSGDGWEEPAASRESWTRYREWRAANNEDRRLYHAPGHWFEPNGAEQLSKTIKFSLELGWDALIAAKPGRQLAFLSHDDRLEVYRGFRGGWLVRQLTGLGYWRRADR